MVSTLYLRSLLVVDPAKRPRAKDVRGPELSEDLGITGVGLKTICNVYHP